MARKAAALKRDEAKFQQHNLALGENLSPEVTQLMHTCLKKIKLLEH